MRLEATALLHLLLEATLKKQVKLPDASGVLLEASNGTPIAKNTNCNVTVANPFEAVENEDDNDGETLDDLGPELAKMGRILAREITKSLLKALIPLQNEINDLKTSNINKCDGEDWQCLRDENEKLHSKVHQLELSNTKLQLRLS